MTPRRHDLELRFGWISIVVVVLFSSAFALGLAAYVVDPAGRAAVTAIHAGLLLLIASPAVRMAVAGAERIRRRDWPFVAMMLVIALELLVVVWRALAKP